jgi:hypothetical protein
MAFLNCNADHHSVALGITDNDALNHIAFLMPDLESVMRGGGRMKDAGHAIEWGPGRHGPGDNAFNYFIDPFGVVIEYTAEVEQVDDTTTSHAAPRLAMAAGPRRPVGHLAAAQRAPESRRSACALQADFLRTETACDSPPTVSKAQPRLGVVDGDAVVDLNAHNPRCRPTARALEAGVDLVGAARAALKSVPSACRWRSWTWHRWCPSPARSSAWGSTTSTTPRRAGATSRTTRGSSTAARARCWRTASRPWCPRCRASSTTRPNWRW